MQAKVDSRKRREPDASVLSYADYIEKSAPLVQESTEPSNYSSSFSTKGKKLRKIFN